MNTTEKITKLKEFKSSLLEWKQTRNSDTRSYINQNIVWVKREVLEAGCYVSITISPPPAIGGLIMRDVDPFSSMFDPPYFSNIMNYVVDMIDKTIGVLLTEPPRSASQHEQIKLNLPINKGFAFVAMPMDENDAQLEDVLDAIKEGTSRCGIQAERVDEQQSNEKISDRMLESIQKAEYVIVDLTNARPNVYYEAGYAQGLNKTPIYIARHGTKLEFDLKDYPIIFFKNLKELKSGIENRLLGLSRSRVKT